MISIDIVIQSTPGLTRPTLERWIANQWIRPDRTDDRYQFAEIDVARVHLIHELSTDLAINDDALPIILTLLDQLYDLRRLMAVMREHDHPGDAAGV